MLLKEDAGDPMPSATADRSGDIWEFPILYSR